MDSNNMLQTILTEITSIKEGQYQMQEEITGIKEGQYQMQEDINKLDIKVDTNYKKLSNNLKKTERCLLDEISLHGKYIYEDLEKVSDKLKIVIDKNHLIAL